MYNVVSLFSLGAVFVTAAGLDDTANTSSSLKDPTPQHETLEAETDMEARQGTTQERLVLLGVREDHTTGNQQGIICN